MSGPATEGSVQQRVHRMSVGHDERLVVSTRFLLSFYLSLRFSLFKIPKLSAKCPTEPVEYPTKLSTVMSAVFKS